MTRVFGGCIEPGGMELDDNSFIDACQNTACGMPANFRVWEGAEGGSINLYQRVRCTHCGYFESDHPGDDDEPMPDYEGDTEDCI